MKYILSLNAYRKGHCKYHGIENLNIEFITDDLWVNYMKQVTLTLYTHGGDYSFVLFFRCAKTIRKRNKKNLKEHLFKKVFII